MLVLYGSLLALNRTSRYGRKILPSPYFGLSSASSASMGAFTFSSYTCLWSCQYVFELSASSPSKNSRASAGQPLNAVFVAAYQSTRAWYTSCFSCDRKGYVLDGSSWVRNSTV